MIGLLFISIMDVINCSIYTFLLILLIYESVKHAKQSKKIIDFDKYNTKNTA